MNQWLDGDRTLPLEQVKGEIMSVAHSIMDFQRYFPGDEAGFLKFKELAESAAGWAGKIQEEKTGTVLRSGFSTDDFKRWFGKSITTNSDGTPKVYYHGTKSDIESFNKDSAGKVSGFSDERGFYFTEDPSYASNYSGEYVGGGSRTMPVYLKIENPLRLNKDHAGYLSTKMKENLEAQGYDGIVAKMETVVWNPEQIKSIFNEGTFDSTNPNILKSGFSYDDMKKVSPWFSTMQRFIFSAVGLPEKVTPSGFKKLMEGWAKEGKFKKEEWADTQRMTQLDSWLKQWGDKKIPKEVLKEWFEEHGIKVEEVIYPKYNKNNILLEPTKHEGYTLPGGENYVELILTSPQAAEMLSDPSHFVEGQGRKQIGWVRGKNFIDAEGKKVFLIEEIQSPRHQQGRDPKGPGYKEPVKFDYMDEYEKVTTRLDEIFREKMGVRDIKDPYEAMDKLDSLDIEDRQLRERLTEINIAMKKDTGVPDAPFHESAQRLMLRRVLRWAAEREIDKVAWTTGEQQAQRWSLKQVADTLSYDKTNNTLIGYKAGNRTIFETVEPERLPNYIGKELTEQLLNPTREKEAILKSVEKEAEDIYKSYGLDYNTLSIRQMNALPPEVRGTLIEVDKRVYDAREKLSRTDKTFGHVQVPEGVEFYRSKWPEKIYGFQGGVEAPFEGAPLKRTRGYEDSVIGTQIREAAKPFDVEVGTVRAANKSFKGKYDIVEYKGHYAAVYKDTGEFVEGTGLYKTRKELQDRIDLWEKEEQQALGNLGEKPDIHNFSVQPGISLTPEMREYYKKGMPLYSGIPTEALKFKKAMEIASKFKIFSLKTTNLERYHKLMKAFVDTRGNIKNELWKQAKTNPDAYNVVVKLINNAGSSGRAVQIAEVVKREIYSGLNKTDKHALDSMIYARRLLQIDQQHPGYEFPFKLKPSDARTFLASTKEMFGFDDAKAGDMARRVDRYFDVAREQLAELRDEGILSVENFNRLKDFDYSRTKMLSIDPPTTQTTLGGKIIDVGESGIEHLRKGVEGEIPEIDSQLLVTELIARTQTRIMNNRLNKALYDLVKDSDNSIAQVLEKDQAVPDGMKELNLFIDGKRHRIAMWNNWAREWIEKRIDANVEILNAARLASGSSFVRSMATGVNIPFAFAQFPLDLAHTWLTSHRMVDGKWKSLYSPHPPIAITQIVQDLGATFADAWLRKGRFNEYINEGGGMELMTHQGRFFHRKHLATSKTKLDKWQDFLGYPGVSMETWVRLASRERAIRMGATPEEATAIARERLDYGSGGVLPKMIDTVIPYHNASIQATRGLVHAAMRNPKDFSAKIAYLWTFSAGVYLANTMINPECWESITEDEKNRNFIITTPWKFKDSRNDNHHIYIKIPKDPGQQFFSRIPEWIMGEFMGYEKTNWKSVGKSLEAINPFRLSGGPTVDALIAYLGNYDMYQKEPIWKGPEVRPQEEYKDRTHEAFVDIGKVTGLSPERLKVSMQKLFTTGNIYTGAVGALYKTFFSDQPDDIQEMFLAQMLKENEVLGPLSRRWLGVTNPNSRFSDKFNEAEVEAHTKNFVATRGLDLLAKGYLYDKNRDVSEVTKFIREYSKEPELQKSLWERYEMHKLMAAGKIEDSGWWLRMQGAEPETKAKMYRDRIKNSRPEEVARIKREANLVPGIFSDRFWDEYGKVLRQEMVQ